MDKTEVFGYSEMGMSVDCTLLRMDVQSIRSMRTERRRITGYKWVGWKNRKSKTNGVEDGKIQYLPRMKVSCM